MLSYTSTIIVIVIACVAVIYSAVITTKYVYYAELEKSRKEIIKETNEYITTEELNMIRKYRKATENDQMSIIQLLNK